MSVSHRGGFFILGHSFLTRRHIRMGRVRVYDASVLRHVSSGSMALPASCHRVRIP